MDELIKEYLDYLEYQKKYSLYTVDNYDKDITDFKEYLIIKKINFENVDYRLARDYLVNLHEKNYKSKTICRHISSLRNFYRFLVSKNYVKDNPFSLISNPKVEKRLPNFLYYNDLEKLEETPDLNNNMGIRDELIIELLYATGCRVSELSSIKINDIDFENKSIRIFGKGKKERIVFYGEKASKLIDNYLNIRNFNNEYLILNSKGKKITDRGIRLILEKNVQKSGVKTHVTPHTMRHTFATHMLNEGAPLIAVQELLGHEDLKATEIYTHVSNERLRRVYLETHPRAKEKKNEKDVF